MITPMLSGVVYLYTLKGLVEVCKDWSISRLYLHSFIAKLPESFNADMADVHVLAGLTAFANAAKLAAFGDLGSPSHSMETAVRMNRRRLIEAVNEEWERTRPGHINPQSNRVKVIHGIVSDYLPPIEAIVPIDNALESKPPDDLFPIRTLQ